MGKKALIIVDVQRGFMPSSEGNRLNKPGFGELPAAQGHTIVPAINRFMEWAKEKKFVIVTTQDWHPPVTAHFSENPNYTSTWPTHCIADTPGAFLHPDLMLEYVDERFVKGTEVLRNAEKDLSYSGFYATNHHINQDLPTYLFDKGVDEVVICGLVFDYCVGKTALDFKKQYDKVTIISNMTVGMNADSTIDMMEDLAEAGMCTYTDKEYVSE